MCFDLLSYTYCAPHTHFYSSTPLYHAATERTSANGAHISLYLYLTVRRIRNMLFCWPFTAPASSVTSLPPPPLSPFPAHIHVHELSLSCVTNQPHFIINSHSSPIETRQTIIFEPFHVCHPIAVAVMARRNTHPLRFYISIYVDAMTYSIFRHPFLVTYHVEIVENRFQSQRSSRIRRPHDEKCSTARYNPTMRSKAPNNLTVHRRTHASSTMVSVYNVHNNCYYRERAISVWATWFSASFDCRSVWRFHLYIMNEGNCWCCRSVAYKHNTREYDSKR